MFFYILCGIFVYLLLRLFRNPFPKNEDLPRKYTSDNVENESYDYIVIGAGSSGCTLTSKLVDGGHSVLLLENGSEQYKSPQITDPSKWCSLFLCQFDYSYHTSPQKNSNNREIPVNRGNILGGSSSVNACVFVRGCKQDYNRWESEHGCKGWKWEDLIPSFKYCETYKEGDETRGKEGPIFPTLVAKNSKIVSSMIDSVENAGITKKVKDYNRFAFKIKKRFQSLIFILAGK